MSRITISPTTARRLAVTRQHLADAERDPSAQGILNIVRDLGCLQLDPISTVARSHTLVTFSRVGPYDPAHLDALIYRERQLFEYWAHAASLVLTEEYPIHAVRMRTYAKTDDPWHRRIAEWIAGNRSLRDYILREIKRRGPLPSRYFSEQGHAPKSWVSSGWTNDRNVSRMLDFMWMQGRIMVARREGLQKWWDLSERVLPEWTPRVRLSEREVVKRAAQKSLRALGVGTARHIEWHYISGRYPGLPGVLEELEREGKIRRLEIGEKARAWKGTWYVHVEDMARVEQLEASHGEATKDGDWTPRTVLLSPFDNLIRDRARTKLMWDFDYKIEIYTPQHKRKFGYYVLPILYGDRLIGRVDPGMDRARGALKIHAVHAEPGAPMDRKTARAVRGAIEELAQFLGAAQIEYSGERVPAGWARDLK